MEPSEEYVNQLYHCIKKLGCGIPLIPDDYTRIYQMSINMRTPMCMSLHHLLGMVKLYDLSIKRCIELFRGVNNVEIILKSNIFDLIMDFIDNQLLVTDLARDNMIVEVRSIAKSYKEIFGPIIGIEYHRITVCRKIQSARMYIDYITKLPADYKERLTNPEYKIGSRTKCIQLQHEYILLTIDASDYNYEAYDRFYATIGERIKECQKNISLYEYKLSLFDYLTVPDDII